jgi:hypothetical protein
LRVGALAAEMDEEQRRGLTDLLLDEGECATALARWLGVLLAAIRGGPR